jgi:Raf kinase inhibitor-like YbhB/YbcL family protein
MNVTSKAFGNGQPIPEQHSQEGDNVSPPLRWTGSPQGVKEFAIIVEDTDAHGPQPWVHWLLWGIPGATGSIDEGDGSAFTQGKNSNGRTEYSGPLPPPGNGDHHYHFEIYALDRPVELKDGAIRDDLLKAMEGHILDRGELVGIYRRR